MYNKSQIYMPTIYVGNRSFNRALITNPNGLLTNINMAKIDVILDLAISLIHFFNLPLMHLLSTSIQKFDSAPQKL